MAALFAAVDEDRLLLEGVAEGEDVTDVSDRAAVLAAANAAAGVLVTREFR